MSLVHLRAFVLEIGRNAQLAAVCASDRAADADDQAAIAREAGFDVHPADLVNCQDGALVEHVDEDFYMKPNWWALVEGVNVPSPDAADTIDFDGDGIIDAIRIGDKWVLPDEEC